MFSQQKSTLILFSLASTLMFLGACGGGGVTLAESSELSQAETTTSKPITTKSEQSSGKEQGKLTQQSKLAINGIGPVRVGMSVTQAEAAAGIRLTRPDSKECSYVRPQGSNYDLLFMVTNNRISRIDVRGNSRITTVQGAGIGDSESKIKSLYPGQISVTPHKYQPNSHYLTFTPNDRSDANYRIVFETDGNRVTSFRSGKLPEVEWVEGCS